MNLFLMRHGRAGDAASDTLRELTDTGRRDVGAVARHVAARGVTGAAVFSSPLVRARQTADLLAVEAGCGPVTVAAELASGASLDALLALVGRLPPKMAATVFVGHMPDLGELAGFLAWGERGRVLDLAPGTIVALHLAHPDRRAPGTLEWVVAPEDVR